jgi:inner membrane protein
MGRIIWNGTPVNLERNCSAPFGLYYGEHMEPVTHFLAGACIGRAGFNRKTAAATLVATLAAEAADCDILWGLRGPVAELQHHRGITHTLIGAPMVASVVVGIVGGVYAVRARGRRPASPDNSSRQRTKPPLRWGWLCLTALVAAFSHILLDWTNNYGVRPFFPFNPQWYAGSFMFIAEPILWALFAMALILPWIFGLADREIGARRPEFRGRGWAIFALAGMVVLWCWRWTERAHGVQIVQDANLTNEPIVRVALEPYPINPWRWHAILETKDYYQTAEVNTHTDNVESDSQRDVLYKPDNTPAVEAAKQTYLGRIYLDWGTWAIVRDLGQEPIPGIDPPKLSNGRTWTTVQFADLRFAYAFRGTGDRRPPSTLSGLVYIVDGNDEAGMAMGAHEQK